MVFLSLAPDFYKISVEKLLEPRFLRSFRVLDPFRPVLIALALF